MKALKAILFVIAIIMSASEGETLIPNIMGVGLIAILTLSMRRESHEGDNSRE